MTHIFFIRHCQPDTAVHDDLTRPLTAKGLADRELVNAYLKDKSIDAVLSSPYKRAVDTVGDFAARHDLPVVTLADLRERKVGDVWIEDFMDFARRQWEDHDYALENGESLNQVESRCVAALERILHTYREKRVAVGFHGTALCALIYHHQPKFGFEDFRVMCRKTPWAAHFVFDGDRCVSIEGYDLFSGTSENIM